MNNIVEYEINGEWEAEITVEATSESAAVRQAEEIYREHRDELQHYYLGTEWYVMPIKSDGTRVVILKHSTECACERSKVIQA